MGKTQPVPGVTCNQAYPRQRKELIACLAPNRRVEVEVWYDKTAERAAQEQVLLKESFKRTRYDSTLPSEIVTSCSQTSATRRSRSVEEARSTAAAAAFSQDVGLVPTISMIL